MAKKKKFSIKKEISWLLDYYKKNLFIGYMTFIFLFFFSFVGILTGLFSYYENQLPPMSELENYDMIEGSVVYDKNLTPIKTFVYGNENRKIIKLSEAPEFYLKMLLSVEDIRFYEHWGIDLYGLMRSFAVNLAKLKLPTATSTITQQLARNLSLSFDKTMARKIKEMMFTILIEKKFSKDEILEMYINKIYLGAGAYGIQAASKKFFNKDAKDINYQEAALLVGLGQLPGAYSPILYPDRAQKRRNIILARAKQVNLINDSLFDTLKNTPLEIYSPSEKENSIGYFIEYVRQELLKKYTTDQIFAEGMKIYTTLDLDLQNYADSVLNNHLTEIETKADFPNKYEDVPLDTVNIETKYLQGGIFAIEPSTGYVRVLIGGRNYNHSKFNRIMQAKRQPGSSFKPILYTTALENGYTPATVICDQPIIFSANDTITWMPRNYTYKYYGFIRMRYALKNSINIFAIKMIYDVGPSKVMQEAKKFGITTYIEPSAALAVGVSEVYPYELITAYSVFANEGNLVNPIFITKVVDANGKILEVNTPQSKRIVNEKTAFLMNSMLQSVIKEGTGVGVRYRGYNYPAGGKTGTTDDYKDAWFIGYNKKLVIGIWTGFDDNTPMRSYHSGSVVALPIWPDIMLRYIKNEKYSYDFMEKLTFEPPNGIINKTISEKTGFYPSNNFEKTLDEYFISGTEPDVFSESQYNTYPTMYDENKDNPADTLIYDLGGKPYIPSPQKKFVEKLNEDSVLVYVEVPKPKMIDFENKWSIKNRKYIKRNSSQEETSENDYSADENENDIANKNDSTNNIENQ